MPRRWWAASSRRWLPSIPTTPPPSGATPRLCSARLDALAAELDAELAPLADKPYIVFHDALQYLERRYGLNVVGSISINPDVPPSGKRLRELRRKILALGAVCVFVEPAVDTRLVDNLIEGTTARTATLDPEGGRLEPGPDLYVTLMRRLAADLRGCLGLPFNGSKRLPGKLAISSKVSASSSITSLRLVTRVMLAGNPLPGLRPSKTACARRSLKLRITLAPAAIDVSRRESYRSSRRPDAAGLRGGSRYTPIFLGRRNGIYSQPSVLAPTTDQRSVRAARSASHRKGRIEPMLGTAGLSLLIVSLVLLRMVVPRNGQGSGRPELLDIFIALVLAGGITSGLLLTLAAVLG